MRGYIRSVLGLRCRGNRIEKRHGQIREFPKIAAGIEKLIMKRGQHEAPGQHRRGRVDWIAGSRFTASALDDLAPGVRVAHSTKMLFAQLCQFGALYAVYRPLALQRRGDRQRGRVS